MLGNWQRAEKGYKKQTMRSKFKARGNHLQLDRPQNQTIGG